tara:strand:- start:29838 stop:30593 length:756 start_codon:yes stop_codon:yes gene_type:complete
MKRIFHKKLTNILKANGYRKKTKFDKTFIEGVLFSMMFNKPDDSLLKIIQVGANKGIIGDPLHNFLKGYGKNVSILFIEPQISLKDELVNNTSSLCAETNYLFSAISSKEGTATMYVPNPNLFPNSSGGASLHEEHLLTRYRKKMKNPSKGYSKLTVETRTLTSVANEFNCFSFNNQQKIICDVLVVDAEGHDDTVIYSVEDTKTLPPIISFEWKNLSNNNYKNLIDFLEDNNYKIIKWNKTDAMAFRFKT